MPNDWEQASLGDIADFYKGKGVPKDSIVEQGDFECIHYGELFTKYRENITEIISRTNDRKDVFLSKKNDVLMPTSDVTPRGLSTASFLDKDGVILSGDVLVIRSDPAKLHGLYFAYFVTANKHKVIRLVSGSTVFHLYGSDLARLELSLPHINEQKKITRILEIWEHALNVLDECIKNKRSTKSGLAQRLLSGDLRLPGFTNEWKTVKLDDICNIKRGGSPRPIDEYITNSQDGLNWLRIGDIETGSRYIRQTKQKIKPEGLNKTTMVHEGDFILSNSMSFGRPYIMKTSACIHDGWLALMDIKPSVNKSFLYYMLSSGKVQGKFASISAGSGVQNLKKETVGTVEIQIPDIAEQTAIAKILHDADDEIDLLIKKREIFATQKKYLVDNLISGNIRVPHSMSTEPEPEQKETTNA